MRKPDAKSAWPQAKRIWCSIRKTNPPYVNGSNFGRVEASAISHGFLTNRSIRRALLRDPRSFGHSSQVASTVTAATAGTVPPPSAAPIGIGVGQTPSELDQAAMTLSVGSSSVAETIPSVKPQVWTLPCLSLDARTRELSELAESVKQCTRCEQLVRSRKQTVFGVGDPQAKIVFLEKLQVPMKIDKGSRSWGGQASY